ncbi:54S ribosomal protein L4 [Colletotrichum spinosum]|uniref:Large ribosomal subunit protein uL29m n=1 Tax=Colletotrichum spinosum TaxID=1347390 RepID=A0A4R8QFT4_9PEZI|nr:54S ribosomal protein L4 [Colletotrichum spinosum]
MAHLNSMRPSIGSVLRASATSVSPRITTSSFSTSAAQSARKTRDNNRLRGVTTMRRSGPREPLSVSFEEIPKPANYKRTVSVDPYHGLWEFFYNKEIANVPAEDQSHGRAWEVSELRLKSWEDLHALWYICLKERNRIATARRERLRRRLGFGDHEADERERVVKSTMKRIKHVLTERFYVWEDANKLAEQDPHYDLSGEGQVYTEFDGVIQFKLDPTEVQAYEQEYANAQEGVAEQKVEAEVGAEADNKAVSGQGSKIGEVEVETQPAETKAAEKPAEKPAPSIPVPKL